MSDATEVKSLVKALNAAGTSPGTREEVLVILNRLSREVAATESLLKETKVGVAVSKQRSNADKEVSELAKAIVKKWKSAVHPDAKMEKPKAKSQIAHVKSGTTSASASPAPGRASELPLTPVEGKTSAPSANPIDVPRTNVTDGVSLPSTNNATRDKCLQMVYNALASDSGAPVEQILKKALGVESSVYDESKDVNAAYRNKMRRLFLNLNDKNNPRLRESVVNGDLPVKRFCTMSASDMASEERKQADARLNEENMFKAQAAMEQEAETDAFKCGRCKQRKTRYRQAQTRSADEPMTTFVTCVNCGNRWKFS